MSADKAVHAPAALIVAKRDGHALRPEEIRQFVEGFMDGSVADYQMSAFCMAVYFQGMSFEETVALTLAMRDSGQVLDFSRIDAPKIGKHSTGGVGDKVSICLTPIMAACGLTIPKLSGRGLGYTGGTLDKLESIPGFRVDLSIAEFRAQLRRLGLALIGQTGQLAPADKRIYALRDVSGTVESIPLITSSILAKKLTEGLDGLVLDVKVGLGAFMKTRTDAEALARTLVRVGRLAGTRVAAVLTEMDAPLGLTVGNALETAEAIAFLHGDGPDDLMEVTLAVGTEMLRLGGIARSDAQAQRLQEQALRDRSALGKLRQMVAAQGGDVRVIDEPDRLRPASSKRVLRAPKGGFVRGIDALRCGRTAMQLGAGRTKLDDPVDPGAGIRLHVRRGDRVAKGAALATLYTSDRQRLGGAAERLREAFAIGKTRPRHVDRVLDVIRR